MNYACILRNCTHGEEFMSEVLIPANSVFVKIIIKNDIKFNKIARRTCYWKLQNRGKSKCEQFTTKRNAWYKGRRALHWNLQNLTELLHREPHNTRGDVWYLF